MKNAPERKNEISCNMMGNVLSSITDIIFVFDSDSKFIYYHAPKDTLLYSNPKDFIGKKFSHAMPKYLHHSFEEAFERAKKGLVSEFDYLIKIKGKNFIFSVKVSPIMNSHGFEGCVAVARDITEMKKNEAMLHESRERFRKLFELIPEAIVFLDFKGNIIDANMKACNIIGMAYSKIIGKNLFDMDFIDEKSKKIAVEKLKERMSGKENPPYELNFKSKEGELHDVLVHGKLICEPEIKGDLIIIEDITERKRMEEDLRQSEQRFKKEFLYYKELDQIKNEFVNLFSHELKKPIISVISYSDLFLGNYLGSIDSEQRKAIESMKKHAEKEISMISEMMNLRNLEKKRVKINYSEFSVNDFAKSIAESKTNESLNKGIKIIFKPLEKDINIYSDRKNLFKALSNIFQNAIIFTDKGSVTVSVRKEKGFILISVKDTGIGIPKEKFDKLFTKFYQVDSSISRVYEGTGIGLYTAKLIVEILKGEIKVESEVGKGSTFTVKIPIK